MYIDDLISGTGTYIFPNGEYMVGNYIAGDLNGLVQEFYASGQVKSLGQYKDNTRTGVVYHFDEYGGCTFGKVNDKGDISGSYIAYVYPDKQTSLIGTFIVSIALLLPWGGLWGCPKQ